MFTWLALNSLCALPLAVLALALGRVARAAPHVEHLAWCLVLLRLVLPPLPAVFLGLFIFARKRRREQDAIPKSRRAKA